MYRQSAHRWLEAIHPAVGCQYFPPGLRLPSQPKSVTAHRPIPNYTAWWQRHMRVSSLHKAVTWKWTGRDSNPRPFGTQMLKVVCDKYLRKSKRNNTFWLCSKTASGTDVWVWVCTTICRNCCVGMFCCRTWCNNAASIDGNTFSPATRKDCCWRVVSLNAILRVETFVYCTLQARPNVREAVSLVTCSCSCVHTSMYA